MIRYLLQVFILFWLLISYGCEKPNNTYSVDRFIGQWFSSEVQEYAEFTLNTNQGFVPFFQQFLGQKSFDGGMQISGDGHSVNINYGSTANFFLAADDSIPNSIILTNQPGHNIFEYEGQESQSSSEIFFLGIVGDSAVFTQDLNDDEGEAYKGFIDIIWHMHPSDQSFTDNMRWKSDLTLFSISSPATLYKIGSGGASVTISGRIGLSKINISANTTIDLNELVIDDLTPESYAPSFSLIINEDSTYTFFTANDLDSPQQTGSWSLNSSKLILHRGLSSNWIIDDFNPADELLVSINLNGELEIKMNEEDTFCNSYIGDVGETEEECRSWFEMVHGLSSGSLETFLTGKRIKLSAFQSEIN